MPAIPYNRRSYTVKTPPAAAVVSLDQFKQFARIDGNEEDAVINDFIAAATAAIEGYTSVYLAEQTITYSLDTFPNENKRTPTLARGGFDDDFTSYFALSGNFINIGKRPIQSVSSIKVYDTNNNAVTLNAGGYTLDKATARISFYEGLGLALDARNVSAIEIEMVVGYERTSLIPADLILAIKQLAKDYYECRSICSMSCDCMGLISKYRDYSELGI